jgi:hypothetical protein
MTKQVFSQSATEYSWPSYLNWPKNVAPVMGNKSKLGENYQVSRDFLEMLVGHFNDTMPFGMNAVEIEIRTQSHAGAGKTLNVVFLSYVARNLSISADYGYNLKNLVLECPHSVYKLTCSSKGLFWIECQTDFITDKLDQTSSP